MKKALMLLCLFVMKISCVLAQPFDRQDSLRGGNGMGRYWWDVQHYDLKVDFNLEEKDIYGQNTIRLKITDAPHDSLQLDLQTPMFLDKVILEGQELRSVKEGNVWWVLYPFSQLKIGEEIELEVYYHGKPREAKNPPWDGGVIWTRDSTGKAWIAVACQGLGASAWWPCKDDQRDEPDAGMRITLSGAGDLAVISNGLPADGRLLPRGEGTWLVKNPINNYNLSFYIGNYIGWQDTLMGEKGLLPLSFYALDDHLAQAKKQFAVVKPMLHCLEHWMGPYPFYEDGYKLIEAPYLGMEHQSAIAYGNGYQMGYAGRDRSNTGVGLEFDFIIIHESAHEWFGNNITAKEVADNWIHEGFTSYAENLFVECLLGKEKALTYHHGLQALITNEKPVIGTYGVQQEGSDIYEKGRAVIQMIRTMMQDDEAFRQLLRGLNQTFYHQTVTSAQVEDFITEKTGLPLKPFFDQYLRQANLPTLEYANKGRDLYLRLSYCLPGLELVLPLKNGKEILTTEWLKIPHKKKAETWQLLDDFLLERKEVKGP